MLRSSYYNIYGLINQPTVEKNPTQNMRLFSYLFSRLQLNLSGLCILDENKYQIC